MLFALLVMLCCYSGVADLSMEGERDMEQCYVISPVLRNRLPIPEPCRSRWPDIAAQTGDDAPYLIFLAESLTLLCGGEKAVFHCAEYSEVDMFGGEQRNWSLTAGSARIFRNIKSEIRESWSSLRYDADVTEITGLSDGRFITWDGEVGGRLEIGDLTAEQRDALLSLARTLFRDVEPGEKKAHSYGNLRSDLLMGKNSSRDTVRQQMKGLIALAGDKDEDVAVAALRRLQACNLLSEPPVVPVVSRALKDGSSRIRREAAALPGMNRDMIYLPMLIKALRDGDSSVEEAAIGSLRSMGDSSAVPHLLSILNRSIDDVRKMAVIALGDLAAPDQKDEVIAGLIPCLKDESLYVRNVTLYVLSHYRDRRLVVPVMACLEDNYDWNRREAASVLGDLGDSAAVPALIKALGDREKWVVISSLNALEKLGDRKALEAIRQKVEREKARSGGGDEQILEAAQKALKKLGD